LFLLLFIAGPLRRFGAYTIPDFAEGRYDSPLFRRIAVIFVLFIGFFYTMPQMKGAGTTLAYIFPGLDYKWGVILVGVVITLNVALGGMKGITLVQAFQYWIKMFAISVPIFVLMAVYGQYGKQLSLNDGRTIAATAATNTSSSAAPVTNLVAVSTSMSMPAVDGWVTIAAPPVVDRLEQRVEHFLGRGQTSYMVSNAKMVGVLMEYSQFSGRTVIAHTNIGLTRMLGAFSFDRTNWSAIVSHYEEFLTNHGVALVPDGGAMRVMTPEMVADWRARNASLERKPLPAKAPKDEDWISPFGPLTTKAAKAANASPRWDTSAENRAKLVDFLGNPPEPSFSRFMNGVENFVGSRWKGRGAKTNASQFIVYASMKTNESVRIAKFPMLSTLREYGDLAELPVMVATNVPRPILEIQGSFQSREMLMKYLEDLMATNGLRVVHGKDDIKAVAASDWERFQKEPSSVTLVPMKLWSMHSDVEPRVLMLNYSELLEKHPLMTKDLPTNHVDFNPTFEVMLQHEAKAGMEKIMADAGVTIIPAGKEVWAVRTADAAKYQLPPVNERAYSLLYTYSLIIALVCGTAGLPHILVRFYTNPDGVAAKRTTMWVMILIGAFYLFPPVFGVIGRNLLPELYNATGAKGTDKVVLELPSLLNAKIPGLGSVLSGVTCAGAFAAFMSTFSGLLVSMTGALAHDVYGRILRPKSTPEQRLRAFKISAAGIGLVAIVLGMQVEKLDINFMVGQAFAIAAASYFPLLFLSTWWRGMTMRGAACGMLGGGLLALCGITLTSFSDLKWLAWDAFWATHPLWRILCEQPAIWAVPLAIGLMIVVSKLTRRDVPADVRMKMLVLHAPEKLGLKQEYIQEHQH
jgi:Na+(H+)/acetate symporter ActP